MAGFSNDTMYADNVDFTGNTIPSPQVTADGDLLIGNASSPNIRVGNLTSPLGTLQIGYSAPDITLDLVGGTTGVDSFAMQTGTSPVLPNAAGLVTFNGAVVAAGTNPVRTDGTGATTMALEIQISQAIASTNSTNIGLSAFNSAQFSVDANGFVSIIDGGFPWSDVSGAFSPLAQNGYFITGTATGTLPASPTQGDTIQFVVDHASQVLTIDAPGTQIIRFGNLVTAAGGTAVSTAQGDSCELVYRASDTCWFAVDIVGTWIIS